MGGCAAGSAEALLGPAGMEAPGFTRPARLAVRGGAHTLAGVARRTYNGPNHQVTKAADKLSEIFERDFARGDFESKYDTELAREAYESRVSLRRRQPGRRARQLSWPAAPRWSGPAPASVLCGAATCLGAAPPPRPPRPRLPALAATRVRRAARRHHQAAHGHGLQPSGRLHCSYRPLGRQAARHRVQQRAPQASNGPGPMHACPSDRRLAAAAPPPAPLPRGAPRSARGVHSAHCAHPACRPTQ